MSAGSGIPLSREQLLESLTNTLLGGDFKPGERLPSERALSELYSVSRPVVREAMQRLRERGLIHVAPGSGAYLKESSALDWARSLDAVGRHRAATTRQLVEARVMLEDQAALLAAERATPEDLKNLERALAAFDAAGNVIDRARCDIAFHALIAKASHNPVIEMMFGAIAPLVFEVMLRSLDDPVVMSTGAPLHVLALDAIREGDGARASEIMHQHINLAATMFGPDFDAQIDSIGRHKSDSLFGKDVALEDVIAAALAE
ncbi:FadR/GntR family transcriptional regulator [uncultured Microbacterium sp.]|uniref:FadR/GntR family transcriptional regulator n=1 Tax=uncultured Microbacterium sp. TaxID=191216 RepID=UPI0035CC50D3